MNNRILGYSVIAFVICFLVIPILYLIWQTSEPKTIRTITFKGINALSFLSVQDPVRIQGVEVGAVKKVSIKDNNVAHVLIETDRSVVIHEGYSVSVMAKGVMGDRYLTIMPGDLNGPVISEKQLLHGNVSIGPDEALSYISELRSAIHRLVTLSDRLYRGNTRNKSLVESVWTFTREIDSIICSVATMVSSLDTSLQNKMDSVTVLLDTTLQITGQIATALPAASENMTAVFASIESLLGHIDSLLTKVDGIVKDLEAPDLLIWKKSTADVKTKLTSLQGLLEMLRGDSLSLPVRLW